MKTSSFNIASIIIIMIFVSCHFKNKNINHLNYYNQPSKSIPSNKDASNCLKYHELKSDTIFVSKKVFVTYNSINEKEGYLMWGEKGQFIRRYERKILRSHVYPDDRFSIFENYIKFDDYCGTGCYYSVLFPLDKKSQIKILFYPTYFDIKKGVIVYGGDESGVFIIIFDVRHNRELKIYDTEIGEFYRTVPKIGAIEKVYFANNNLVIQWFTDKINKTRKIYVNLNELKIKKLGK